MLEATAILQGVVHKLKFMLHVGPWQAEQGRIADRDFVVVHNGRRDSYQVALALQEANRLAALVTDYYSKSGLVRRRSHPDLSSALVRNTWPAVVIQALSRARLVLGTSRRPVEWSGVERALGDRAREQARRSGANVIAYSGGLAYRTFQTSQEQRVLFLFHPMAGLIRSILADDARSWSLPQSAFQTEREFFDVEAEDVALDELRAATSLLVASTLSRKSVETAGQAPAPPTAVVPYGCPPVYPMVRRGEGHRVLFVGQGVQRKGLHHLAAVWPSVQAHCPRASLTVVSGAFAPGLDLSGLEGRVDLRPRVSQGELDALMDSHDILVLPSLVEGFGLVITEALAHGMHVLATRHTGLIDLPLHPGAGTLVDPGDREELFEALVELLQNGHIDYDASYATAADYQWEDYRVALRRGLSL